MDPTTTPSGPAHDTDVPRADVGIWTWDTDSGEIVWSSDLNDLYGATPTSPATSASWYAGLVHPDDAATVAEALERVVSAGGDASVAYRTRGHDGDQRSHLVRAQRDASSGRVTGVVIDLTDRERAVASSLREKQSAQELRDLNAQKDAFIRAVSHDLRSPLLVIERFAEILGDVDEQLSAEERVAHANRIVDASRRVQRQLEDLLDLDRLARRVVSPERRPTDLTQLALESIQALDLGDRAVVSGERLVADVDAGLVERILENLLTNAHRHGGEAGRISVHLAPHDGGVLITVDDEGPGIPVAQREGVFQVFKTGPAASSGAGVGLSVVRQFAQLHGGSAWVEDAPGGGASLNVMLRAAVR